jgi:hypothetical protein
MIKVRVLRGVQVGLTGASGLIALSSGLAACTADAGPGEDVETDESALTVQNPGTGVFSLGWVYGTPTGYSFVAKNSTDEYVRAREKMTFAIPAHFLWTRLYPNDALPNDTTRLKQLAAKVKVVYVKDGATYASTSVATTAWQGGASWELAATTSSFIVSRRAQGIRFEVTITDAADATKSVTVGQGDFLEVPVIGGSLPNKTALFDTMGSSMRQRVLEGGKPVSGAELAIGYTDWRAATVVDTSSIDRTIGNATSYGRFGSFEMPIQGELEHEISYAVAIDGVWQDEKALTANAKSRLMPPYGRTAYEGSISVPNGAQKLEIYFHVKTFLKVDYSRFSNVGWRKYADGARILVREKWDNENGAYADNYDFATESR